VFGGPWQASVALVGVPIAPCKCATRLRHAPTRLRLAACQSNSTLG
jgi:hypothetical protein